MDPNELIARPPRVLQANDYPFRPGQQISPFVSQSIHLIAVQRGHGTVSIAGHSWPVAGAGIFIAPWSVPVAFLAARRDPVVITSVHLRFLPWNDPDPVPPVHRTVVQQPRPFALPPEGQAPDLGQGLVHADIGHHLSELAAQMAANFRAQDSVWRDLRSRGLILAILCGIAENKVTPKRVGAIGEILDWLSFNVTVQCSPAELAQRAGMGRSAFNAAFRAATGRSPMAYVIDQRRAIARRLLSGGQIPVSAIGKQVGIPDQRQFRRLFRTRFGLAPSQWRQGNTSSMESIQMRNDH